MRVLMLSWEYPPLVVGGLGRHVGALARTLAAAGHDGQVVTRGQDDAVVDEIVDEVRVRRAAADPVRIDFTTESLLAWAQAAEHSLVRAALPLLRDRRPDVVHAHDWLVAQSARTIAEFTGSPLVTTMHATEAGRHQGWLPAPLNRAIHSVERWLVHSSAEVIVCSSIMRTELAHQFGIAPERLSVVPNGIDIRRWRVPDETRRATRSRLSGESALLVFAGRLVAEKGLDTVIDALPPLRARHPGLRLAVAGRGGCESELRDRARRRRVARAVEWLGFVPAADLATVLAAADAVLVPSRYEPFGLVALEAAAAGAPLVVADTGGLSEFVARQMVAAAFPPGDVAALVTAVDRVLGDRAAARAAARRAETAIRRDYAWPAVAAQTVQIYRRAAGGRSER